MHFEILVEGQAERTALEPLLTKLLGTFNSSHTWRIHKHRGIGRIPDNPENKPNPKDTTLLHNLPAKLRAYGKSLKSNEVVIVLMDLDDRGSWASFKRQLENLLRYCDPVPNCLFQVAVEELEAWYLGDKEAILSAYPNANQEKMSTYVQDSCCGTWEMLADIVYPGGQEALKKLGWQACLKQKRIWARDIVPKMEIDRNLSPSFQMFKNEIIKGWNPCSQA